MRRTFGADRTNQHHATAPVLAPGASENHHVAVQKTPGNAKTPSRRRALGDISNRKAFGGNATTTGGKQQRGVTFASATKSVSKSVLPSRSSTPFVKNKGVVLATAATTMTTTPRATVLAPPMDDVEFRAGRPFDPFDDEGYELDISSIDLLSMESDMPDSRGASRVPRKHTPQFWMSTFDVKYDDNVDDDVSLMMAPDDIESLDSCIDISLEEEVGFLGLAITDFSF
jgi:hypothetical protein